MIDPPVWNRSQLSEASRMAGEAFRRSRQSEALEEYLDLFDEYLSAVEAVLEQTADLSEIHGHAKRKIFLYLSGPPVSEDDFRVLLEARSTSPGRLKESPELLGKMVDFVTEWHDRRRFPSFGPTIWKP